MSPSSKPDRRFSSSSANSLDVSAYIRLLVEDDDDGLNSLSSNDPLQSNTLSTSSVMTSAPPPQNFEANKPGMQDECVRVGGRTDTIDEQENDVNHQSQHNAVYPRHPKNSQSTSPSSMPPKLPPEHLNQSESIKLQESVRVGSRTFTRITIGGEQQNKNAPHQNRSRTFDSGTVEDPHRETESPRPRPYFTNQYETHQNRRGSDSGHSNEMLRGEEIIGFNSTVLNNNNDQAAQREVTLASRRFTGNMFHDLQLASRYGAELARLIKLMDASERSRQSVHEAKKFMMSEQFKASFDDSDQRQISGIINQIAGADDDANTNTSDPDPDPDPNADKKSNHDQKQPSEISLADIKASRRKPRRRTKANTK